MPIQCVTCEHITVALINGKKVKYDGCEPEKTDYYKAKGFEYIGKGKIYSVAGAIQHFKEDYYFWRKNASFS